jgi:uncharacterized protein (DUF3084 family)
MSSNPSQQHTQQQNITRTQQTEEVIDATGKLVIDEVNMSTQEYSLLTQLNDAATVKYDNIAQHTAELLHQAQLLAQQQDQMAEQFKQLDALHEAATRLESTVGILEKYMDEVEEHFAK